MIAGRDKRRGEIAENIRSPMKDGRTFAMHLARRADHVSSKKLADGLMAEADAQNGFLPGKCFDDINADTSVRGGARAGRNKDALGIETFRLRRSEFVIAENAHIHPQLAEILDQVEGK